MRLPESETEYLNSLLDAAEMGAMKARIDDEKIKPFMSYRAAKRKYGAVLDQWIRDGLIKKQKHGLNNSKIHLDRLRLEALCKTRNIADFLRAKGGKI